MIGFLVVFCLSLTLVSGSVYDHSPEDLDGEKVPLSQYEGKCLLVINTASKCGLTANHMSWLNDVYSQYGDGQGGLAIAAFPSGSFSQEPLDNEGLKQWARDQGAKYDFFGKVDVRQEPLYKDLTESTGGQPMKWNFEKFLIGPDGKVIDRYNQYDGPAPFSSINSAIEQCVSSL